MRCESRFDSAKVFLPFVVVEPIGGLSTVTTVYNNCFRVSFELCLEVLVCVCRLGGARIGGKTKQDDRLRKMFLMTERPRLWARASEIFLNPRCIF